MSEFIKIIIQILRFDKKFFNNQKNFGEASIYFAILIILVSSLCTGKILHPLNLFGLILIWKKIGENFLKNSNLEWTIIRPGGLKENEDIKDENIEYSGEDIQIKGSIPRRLLAKCCIDSLKDKGSLNKIIEVTSSSDNKKISFKKALQMI